MSIIFVIFNLFLVQLILYDPNNPIDNVTELSVVPLNEILQLSVLYQDNGIQAKFLCITKSLQRHYEINRVYESHQLQTRGNQSISALYIPDIPNDCLNATYCNFVPNYPEEYVTYLLTKNNMNLFENKKITKTYTDSTEKDFFEELTVCDYIQDEAKYPKAAKTAQGKWFFIVNPKKNPLQVIKQVICRKENRKCRNIHFRTDLFYNTGLCKQETINKKLASINWQGKIVFMHFPFKCCCSCYVTHTNYLTVK